MKKVGPLLTVMLIALAQPVLGQQAKQHILYSGTPAVYPADIEQVSDLSFRSRGSLNSLSASTVHDAQLSTAEPTAISGSNQQKGRKSPPVAFGLSLLITGLGQHYNGEHVKGVIQEVAVLVGALLIAVGNRGEFPSYRQNVPQMNVGIGICAGSAIWSIIDAPLSASRINRKFEQSHGHLLEFNRSKNVVSLNGLVSQDALGAELSYHF